MKRKKSKIYWLAGLVVLCFIGGAFAYWTQEIVVHNEFKTTKYDTTLRENFISPDNWLPGQEINKDVWITNNGTFPAFAKISLNQEWVRTDNVSDQDGTVISPVQGEAFPLVFYFEAGHEFAAQIKWGSQVVRLKSEQGNDEKLDIPTVDSINEADGKWLMVNDQPDKVGNYTLYYIGLIKADGKTPLLVDAVTMNPHVQPAVISKNTYFDDQTKSWVTETVRNRSYDYECARYTMLINAATVQATEDAVKEIFGTAADDKAVVDYLAAHAVDPANF